MLQPGLQRKCSCICNLSRNAAGLFCKDHIAMLVTSTNSRALLIRKDRDPELVWNKGWWWSRFSAGTDCKATFIALLRPQCSLQGCFKPSSQLVEVWGPRRNGHWSPKFRTSREAKLHWMVWRVFGFFGVKLSTSPVVESRAHPQGFTWSKSSKNCKCYWGS